MDLPPQASASWLPTYLSGPHPFSKTSSLVPFTESTWDNGRAQASVCSAEPSWGAPLIPVPWFQVLQKSSHSPGNGEWSPHPSNFAHWSLFLPGLPPSGLEVEQVFWFPSISCQGCGVLDTYHSLIFWDSAERKWHLTSSYNRLEVLTGQNGPKNYEYTWFRKANTMKRL